MSSLNKKIKKCFLPIFLCFLLLLSGCGLTVTKIENTTQPTYVVETEAESEKNSLITTQNKIEKNTTVTQSENKKSVVSTTEKTTTKKEKTTEKITTKKSTTSSQNNITCTIEIECKKILENIDNLRPEKEAFLPSNGYIIKPTTVTVKKGSTVFDVLEKVCAENTCSGNCQYCKNSGIQMEHIFSPEYDSEYVRGIHQLYEKDCGTRSGWMYSVNGVFPNYGVNKYTVRNGDKIQFRYTCDFGEDF